MLTLFSHFEERLTFSKLLTSESAISSSCSLTVSFLSLKNHSLKWT